MTGLEQEAAALMTGTVADCGSGRYEFWGAPGTDRRLALVRDDAPITLDVTAEESVPLRLAGTVCRDDLEAEFALRLTGLDWTSGRVMATYRPEAAVTQEAVLRHARSEAALKTVRERLEGKR